LITRLYIGAILTVALMCGCQKSTDVQNADTDAYTVLDTRCRITGFPDTVTGNSLQSITYQWSNLPESSETGKFMVKVHFVNSEGTVLFQDDHFLQGKSEYTRELLIPLISRSQKVTMMIGLYVPDSSVKYSIHNSDGQTGPKVPVAQFTVTPPLHIDDLPEARISYGEGWYQKEFGPGANNTWRWISERAECKLKGADRDLILYIHGWVPDDRLDGPVSLALSLDGNPLGVYENLNGEFIIKRVIESSSINNGEFADLTITVDKSFTPSDFEKTDDTRSLSVMIRQFYFN